MPDKTVFRCKFDAACAGSMHIHAVVVTQNDSQSHLVKFHGISNETQSHKIKQY